MFSWLAYYKRSGLRVWNRNMGTLVRITIYAYNAKPMRAAFDRVNELDDKLSDYKPNSELNQLCRTHGQAVKVSEDLFRVLEASQKLAALTNGAFDITVGPVTHLWRLGKMPMRRRWLGLGGAIW